MKKKKILFLTGTRADYGKIKSLMQALEQTLNFELFIFVCGMHLSEKLGRTYEEIVKDGYKNIYIAYGLGQSINPSVNLGNTISSLAGYVENVKPNMIVVHGDRMDALAGAVVGALSNVIVAHIEGGELSGTIDESTRHAISKFAHAHFVCNQEAKTRLIQLGEEKNRIFVIGSPDIDVMMSSSLPTIDKAKQRYDILFDNYAILMYHPVTTEFAHVGEHIANVVDAIIMSKKNYIAIYPNNDLGSEIIMEEFKRFQDNPRFKIYPSLRFEYFLTLLKHADFIIGNSSAGIRESCVYGIPAIDIGTRQFRRYSPEVLKNIQHAAEEKDKIIAAINKVDYYRIEASGYGDGNSTARFIKILNSPSFWNTPLQKQFIDYDM